MAIFWNSSRISSQKIAARLSSFILNDLRELSIKLRVRPNYFEYSSIELYGIGLPPPILASSFEKLWFISYASIEHIKLYLSHLEVVT